MLKLKMMLCVMMLPLVVVGCTSAVCHQREATTASGVDNAAPRLADTRTGLFHLRERLIITKQLEGTQKHINEQCRQRLPTRWQLMQLL